LPRRGRGPSGGPRARHRRRIGKAEPQRPDGAGVARWVSKG